MNAWADVRTWLISQASEFRFGERIESMTREYSDEDGWSSREKLLGLEKSSRMFLDRLYTQLRDEATHTGSEYCTQHNWLFLSRVNRNTTCSNGVATTVDRVEDANVRLAATTKQARDCVQSKAQK